MKFTFNGEHYLQTGGKAMGTALPQTMPTCLWTDLKPRLSLAIH